MNKRATLYLATGLLDEMRRSIKPSHGLHGRFLHDLRWQDTWPESEHNGWSSLALKDWPKSTKPRHTDALAFSVALAVHELSDHRRRRDPATACGNMGTPGHWEDAAKDLHEFVERFDDWLRRLPSDSGLSGSDYSIVRLRKERVLRRADEMLLANRTNIRTSEAGDVRLPRVFAVHPMATAREANAVRDRFLPTFATTPNFAALGHRAASSVAVVEAASALAAEMISERERERERSERERERVRASPPPRGSLGPSAAQPDSRDRCRDASGD